MENNVLGQLGKYEWTRAPHPAFPSAAALLMQQPLCSSLHSINNRGEHIGGQGGIQGASLALAGPCMFDAQL
eukprot:1158270-Pelagomonas_calceolata.AAC.4